MVCPLPCVIVAVRSRTFGRLWTDNNNNNYCYFSFEIRADYYYYYYHRNTFNTTHALLGHFTRRVQLLIIYIRVTQVLAKNYLMGRTACVILSSYLDVCKCIMPMTYYVFA